MKKSSLKKTPISKISASALREFAEIRRIANKAVQKAIAENRKMGLPDSSSSR
jgi:hypothetical protein